ncbi:MAG: hypothetical protein ACK4KW_13955 [Gemmobacter sp.]
MINLNDILDLSCLTREEIEAIAEHEHVGRARAVALGEYLMHLPKGPQHVQTMICDDIRTAIRSGDVDHARALFQTLRAFVTAHPEAVRGSED